MIGDYHHAEIVERRSHYVVFWKVLHDGGRVWCYSDEELRWPAGEAGRLERLHSGREYQKLMKRVNADDPYVR